MIVRDARGVMQHVQRRSADMLLLDATPPPWGIESTGGWGGSRDAAALPAASAAMRLIANDISLLPLMVYQEVDGEGNATKARGTWQWDLLHDQPEAGTPPCIFWFDVAMGIVNRGNAHALKVYGANKQVVSLDFMSGKVQTRMDQPSGATVYDWYRPDGTLVKAVPANRVVHFRGANYDGGPDGISWVTQHRLTFDIGISQNEYRKAFYSNGARGDAVITHPGIKTEEQADTWLDKYEARHRGPSNARRPMLLPQGATVTTMTMSFEDQQFIESLHDNVAEVERIFLLPPNTLQEGKVRPVGGDNDVRQRYVRQAITPLTTLIEQTLEADPDLFGMGSSLYPEFQTAAALKADFLTRSQGYLVARQGGWLSVNDIRAAENLPPVDGGDEYQTTPVGGAPNLQPGSGGAAATPDDGDNSDTGANTGAGND